MPDNPPDPTTREQLPRQHRKARRDFPSEARLHAGPLVDAIANAVLHALDQRRTGLTRGAVEAVPDQDDFPGYIYLACPRCGGTDALHSREQVSVLYPVRMYLTTDTIPQWCYTDEDRIVSDERGVYTGTLWCGNCAADTTETDLVPDYDPTGRNGPLAPPEPQREGQPRHAIPAQIKRRTTCAECGALVEYVCAEGSTDPHDPEAIVGIWGHIGGGYFCRQEATG